jgi:hypothetical protein
MSALVHKAKIALILSYYGAAQAGMFESILPGNIESAYRMKSFELMQYCAWFLADSCFAVTLISQIDRLAGSASFLSESGARALQPPRPHAQQRILLAPASEYGDY